MRDDNKNEVCVIIGAASGMGESCARRLTGRGVLLLADLDASRLHLLAKELTWEGLRVETAVCDVSDKQSIASLVDKVGNLGQLKVLINTAGIAPGQCNDWKRIMSTNMVGTALVLEAFLPLANPGASVVCVASLAGYQCPDVPNLDEILNKALEPDFLAQVEPIVEELGKTFGMTNGPSYLISKHGVHRLIRHEAPKWHTRGTRLISVSPGLIESPMGLQEIQTNPGFIKPMAEMNLWKRMGTPDEVAGPICFLCSDDASFISGCDIIIDGGFMAESSARHLDRDR